jgi:hypothetical protein
MTPFSFSTTIKLMPEACSAKSHTSVLYLRHSSAAYWDARNAKEKGHV